MVDPIQLKEGKVKQTFFMAKWSLKITNKLKKPTQKKIKDPQEEVKLPQEHEKTTQKNVKPTTIAIKKIQKEEKPTLKGKEPTIDAEFEPIDPSNSAIFNDWIESLMPHCLKDEEQSVAGTTWDKIKKDAMRDDY